MRRVGVEQHLGVVVPEPGIGIPFSVNSVSVMLTWCDVREICVPDVAIDLLQVNSLFV